MTQSKAWSFSSNPVLAATPKKYNSITVFGAIGSCIRGNGVFMLADSTNAVDFVKFLELIKRRLKSPYNKKTKPVILLDNAAAHRERESATPTLNRLFVPFFMPPYSCTFNSKYSPPAPALTHSLTPTVVLQASSIFGVIPSLHSRPKHAETPKISREKNLKDWFLGFTSKLHRKCSRSSSAPTEMPCSKS